MSLKNEDIYQTPRSHLDIASVKELWPGKKLLLITCLPSLLMIGAATVIYCDPDLRALFIYKKLFIIYIPILLAGVCSLWTCCHLVSVRKGNALDFAAFSIMWSLGHVLVLLLSYAITLSFTDY